MLAEVLTRVALVVGLMLPVALAVFVGPDRIKRTVGELRPRLRANAPVLLVLGAILLLNRYMRQNAPDVGFFMTDAIYSLEGDFVLIFQDVATPALTEYFSFIYVYGYAFLLIFPPVAYFMLSDTVTFRKLLTAYALNYAIGVIFYVLISAFGPRNFFGGGELVTILYDHNPDVQHLTREVNRNTNVFPSLHTSLSATVATFAYYTRDQYRAWFPVAVLLAVSVIISTMYLAIHWATDVAGGLILAALCVAISHRLVGLWTLDDLRDRLEP